MRSDSAFAIVPILSIVVWIAAIVVWIAAIGGWIANIVKLAAMINDPVTGFLVLRAVGIVVKPLGAVLGYL